MLKFIKFMLWFTIISLILALLGYISIYFAASLSDDLNISNTLSFYLYDKDNNLYNGEDNDWVKLDDISDNLINATIAVEDKNFYKHIGFDYLRIVKAFITNLKNGKTTQGASTISQQYVKNLYLDFDKTWKRKIEEAWLTMKLETHYTKKQILEGYLNTINYGGIYGIKKASLYYFGKEPRDLNLAEASILAGIPKSPSNYSPISNPKNAKKRQELILNAMVENGYITEDEKKEAHNLELTYVGSMNDDGVNILMYYQDAVIDELKKIKSIPSSFISTGGLKIYTALDMNALKILNESIKKNLKNSDLQTSIVLMNPDNGEVIAMSGGKDYSKSEFNRTLKSNRQVGSTMKPFLYYTALENGFTASTTFTSTKTTFMFSNNKTYSPENYGSIYPNKPISLAAALAYSDNIYAVKTHIFLGEENLVDFANRLGISSDLDPLPSLALGTKEINIMKMMKGYATFANLGYQVEPHYITKVLDASDNVLYEYKEEKENVLNKSTVFILNELLTNCYNSKFINYTYPTCASIGNKITKKYAIKTGTTDTDGWIFGFNKDVLLGTWVGYDDNRPTKSSDSTLLKNLWVDIMENYLKDKDNSWYDIPDNVVSILVDPITGEVATKDTKNATLFYYIKGTEPTNKEVNLEENITVWKNTE